MGRQIGIKFSDKKEKEFIEFLLKDKNIYLFPQKTRKNKLNVIRKANKMGEQRTFYISKKEFQFKPSFIELRQTVNQYQYRLNPYGMPLIEYFRSERKTGSLGRLYWEKYFTTSNPDYNVKEFEKWYNDVIKWIKKNCNYEKGVYVG